MRFSTITFSVQFMIDQKHLDNVESFSSVGRLVTSDGRCTREIALRFAIAKQHSTRRRRIFSPAKWISI